MTINIDSIKCNNEVLTKEKKQQNGARKRLVGFRVVSSIRVVKLISLSPLLFGFTRHQYGVVKYAPLTELSGRSCKQNTSSNKMPMFVNYEIGKMKLNNVTKL